MRPISIDELNYYKPEALTYDVVHPKPFDIIPHVFGAIVTMMAADGSEDIGGLLRVVVNPTRKELGFRGGVEISVLDIDRIPVAESTVGLVKYANMNMWVPLGTKAIYSMGILPDSDSHARPNVYTAREGFFIREPGVIKR